MALSSSFVILRCVFRSSLGHLVCVESERKNLPQSLTRSLISLLSRVASSKSVLVFGVSSFPAMRGSCQ